jgi:hypothetical protein
MKLKKSEVRLIVILVFLILITIIYSFGYKPLINYKKELAMKVTTLQKEQDMYTSTSREKEMLKSKIKENNIKLELLNKTLLPEITQERILHLINELKNQVPINTNTINLGKKEYINEENIDLRGFNIKISFDYTGTYNNIKELINWIYNNELYMMIESITMNSDIISNQINGQFDIYIYGMEDKELTVNDVNLKQTSIGKDVIFKPFESFEDTLNINYIIDKSDKGQQPIDFLIKLESVFADYPAVTIAKGDDKIGETYIHSDNKNNEQVYLEINKINNYYYYKYRIGNQIYPIDNEQGILFFPKDTILLKVFSKDRISINDKNTISLDIKNNSDKQIVLYISNDDKKLPRVKIDTLEGKVKVK